SSNCESSRGRQTKFRRAAQVTLFSRGHGTILSLTRSALINGHKLEVFYCLEGRRICRTVASAIYLGLGPASPSLGSGNKKGRPEPAALTASSCVRSSTHCSSDQLEGQGCL